MALSTAHGASTLYSAEWNELVFQALGRSFTTGTNTTMYSNTASTYLVGGVTSSFAYPLLMITIPPFVLPSKVDMNISCATCSTNVVNTSVILVCDGKPGNNFQSQDFKTTATLSTRIQGVITGYFPTTSNWATFSTQITICGGQVIAIYGMSTTAPACKIRNITFTGNASTTQMITSDSWVGIGTTYA